MTFKIKREKFCGTKDCIDGYVYDLAQKGDAEAEYLQGLADSDIIGGFTASLAYWRKAAGQNHMGAEEELCAALTQYPEFINYDEAYKWCWQAANRGSIKAQTIVSVLYREGNGVFKDPEAAYFWLCVAKINFSQVKNKNVKPLDCDNSKDKLTPEQKAKVDVWVTNWKPSTSPVFVRPLLPEASTK